MHLLEKFKLMSDIFCLPEACLLADVIQFMVDQKYQFHPAIVAEDVRKAIDRTTLINDKFDFGVFVCVFVLFAGLHLAD